MSHAACGRCRQEIGPTDRFCRSCGQSLRGARADWMEPLHRTILEKVPVGIFTTDGNGQVQYWNSLMEEHSGVRRLDALGRSLFDVLPHLQPEAHRIMRVLETALPFRLDQVSHCSGHGADLTEAFWFGSILLESGSPALLGVMEDITQKVRVDNRLIRSERLAAIGELAAGVAHNFNNIMAAIGGDAQLLQLTAEEEALPPHVAEAAKQIHHETMRGGRLAHDLLSFARGGEPHLQRVDVRAVLEDAVRLIRNHPSARSVTLQVGISEDLPLVEADPTQLHQVFFNLLLNAIQAQPNGGIVTLSAAVRGHEEDPMAGILDVKFHDTGVGIPREHLRRIFDPFFSHRANGTKGSGLGLTVSLAMIKSLGGDIHVTSAEGLGTTVTVSLPIVERRTLPRSGWGGPRGRVLIVDEDANVRRTLTSLLSRRGYEVVAATDIDTALATFRQPDDELPFDLVLTELMHGGEEGDSPLQRIRAREPRIPVVVLTAATETETLARAVEHGAHIAFSKPPHFAELLGVIDQLSPAAAQHGAGDDGA